MIVGPKHRVSCLPPERGFTPYLSHSWKAVFRVLLISLNSHCARNMLQIKNKLNWIWKRSIKQQLSTGQSVQRRLQVGVVVGTRPCLTNGWVIGTAWFAPSDGPKQTECVERFLRGTRKRSWMKPSFSSTQVSTIKEPIKRVQLTVMKVKKAQKGVPNAACQSQQGTWFFWFQVFSHTNFVILRE